MRAFDAGDSHNDTSGMSGGGDGGWARIHARCSWTAQTHTKHRMGGMGRTTSETNAQTLPLLDLTRPRQAWSGRARARAHNRFLRVSTAIALGRRVYASVLTDSHLIYSVCTHFYFILTSSLSSSSFVASVFPSLCVDNKITELIKWLCFRPSKSHGWLFGRVGLCAPPFQCNEMWSTVWPYERFHLSVQNCTRRTSCIIMNGGP